MSDKEKKHKCVLCNAVLDTKEALQDHFRAHANGFIDKTGRSTTLVADAECVCDLCEEIFVSVTETIKHKFKVHPNSTKFYCRYCGKQFPLKIHIDKHMISHEAEKKDEEEEKKCEKCDFVFYTDKALIFHNESIHENKALKNPITRKPARKLGPKKEHNCVLCDAKLESKDALREHFRKHANNEIDKNGKVSEVLKKFQADCRCDVCDKVYQSITEVIKHRFKSHPHSPKFYCCYCGKQFPLKVHRDKHMTSHDPEEAKIEDHKNCDECNAVFYNEKALFFHRTSVHKRVIQMLQPIATPPPSNKIKVNSMNDALSVYYCHLCGVEYVIKFNLQQHLEKVHTQEERDAVPEDLIKCTMCSALFCNKKAYNIHNTYHKPNDLYVTSEQQRLKTVTKVDQDFDIRRVSIRTFDPQPQNVKRRLQRRQLTDIKRLKEELNEMQNEVTNFSTSSEDELFDEPHITSESDSDDVPLNRRINAS